MRNFSEQKCCCKFWNFPLDELIAGLVLARGNVTSTIGLHVKHTIDNRVTSGVVCFTVVLVSFDCCGSVRLSSSIWPCWRCWDSGSALLGLADINRSTAGSEFQGHLSPHVEELHRASDSRISRTACGAYYRTLGKSLSPLDVHLHACRYWQCATATSGRVIGMVAFHCISMNCFALLKPSSARCIILRSLYVRCQFQKFIDSCNTNERLFA